MKILERLRAMFADEVERRELEELKRELERDLGRVELLRICTRCPAASACCELGKCLWDADRVR